MVAQERQKHRSNWYKMFTTVRIFLRVDQWPTPVHPLCDHGDACAFLLPPLSDLWATGLLGDLCATVWTCSKLRGDYGVHGEVWTSSAPPLNDTGNLSASFVPPTVLSCFVVAQGRHNGRSPCVKGVPYKHGVCFRIKRGKFNVKREWSHTTEVLCRVLSSLFIFLYTG